MTKRTALCLMVLALGAGVRSSSAAGWYDTFYQYRIPLEVEVAAAGWQVLPLGEERIVAAINELEDLPFDERWFAYNNIILAELDEEGQETGRLAEGGFYLLAEGENLAQNIMQAPRDRSPHGMERARVEYDLEAGAFYLLSYISSMAGYSPMKAYDLRRPAGHPAQTHNYYSSYEPPLLPKARTRHERLFIPCEKPLDLHVAGRWATELEDLSVRRARIRFLVDLPEAGLNRFHLYYQPMTGHYLSLPANRVDMMPEEQARLNRMAAAEKYHGRTRYLVSSTDAADLWFAETTVKMTPAAPVPEQAREGIELDLAGGEAQTFQVVISPRVFTTFNNITVSEMTGEGGRLPAAEAKILEYVPIKESSFLTPVAFTGALGDPLVEVEKRELAPASGNLVLCVTVEAERDSTPGTYSGHIHIEMGAETIGIPLTVRVADFALPEFSPFKSNTGGQFLAKGTEPFSLEFHGLSRDIAASEDDLRRLARDYFEIMARNRFHPKTPVLYEEIGMQWDPPPQGYNVDAPGNYFRLYDWDFTRFNETLTYFIDELKVNQVTLMHINPTRANIFFHLPGARLERYPESSPFVTMGWQTFREMTYVAYGKREGDPYFDETIEITRDQFDRLLLDFLRPIAGNLEEHGWLDKAYIMIDETMDQNKLHHFLSLLKSDPLVARIKVKICIQGFTVLDYQFPGSDEYAFKGLIDIYMPQADESYDRWEDFLFPDYGIEPDPEKCWTYLVRSARLCIDTPGVNHRLLALDNFNRGSSGFLIWEMFRYQKDSNPWVDPNTRFGNGMLSIFYPPQRDGLLPTEPDFTITPSIRMLIHRQASQDYDYAWMLEKLVREGRAHGTDVAAGEHVLEDIGRFFASTVHWSQNDAWYLDLRDRMAEAIVDLKTRMGP